MINVATNLSDIHTTFSIKGKIIQFQDIDLVALRTKYTHYHKESNKSDSSISKPLPSCGKTLRIIDPIKKRDKKVLEKT